MVVVASPTRIMVGEKIGRGAIGAGVGVCGGGGGGHVPVVDLSRMRTQVREMIMKACQEYGFFKVVNHGVPRDIIARMENEGFDFFRRPVPEKEIAGPANPFGYGSKNIGFNGDVGEVEYLLLHTNPLSVSQASKAISSDPSNFSSVVNDYIDAVRDLACEILDLMAEGLRVPDKSVLSSLIRDVDSDSLIRLNHYPSSSTRDTKEHRVRVGFGEHSDPQILTLLKSNEVGGLQISLEDGVWVPVPPDPSSFCVNVGDLLQVLTNGRFVSVRHRAMTSSSTRKSRMSMVYFGAPPLHKCISPLPETITAERPSLYRPFTWAEFKKAAYSLRLGDSRVDLFRTHHPHCDLAASLSPPQ
ncbi:gibberellin 2-beta-dioxygenase 2-like [Macadamia integrifolia]|uniref:gibberellin 2-beta-dioxygenase 2-like n=1 Tax=Macadamia integrifolia TaxID=60698 RepID=UPI001C4F7CE4|nr:gibberellin 2-beta-dioxygenase 2-like [Macadamia integrifolia]